MRYARRPWQTTFLVAAMLLGFSNVMADCPSTMASNYSGPCINRGVFRSAPHEAFKTARLVGLWRLENGAIHPPLKLPYLVIEQFAMESIWGLRSGESLMRDPRWNTDQNQPDLEAIAFLHIREMAMSLRNSHNAKIGQEGGKIRD
jgi:hypothetical protein